MCLYPTKRCRFSIRTTVAAVAIPAAAAAAAATAVAIPAVVESPY